MRKIIALSIAALLVLGMVGVGTWAYFSDTEQSTGNVFTAGTLNLKLTDNNETDLDGVVSSWNTNNSNMAPGSAAATGTVTLKNTGSITANHVEIKFANTPHNSDNAAAIATDTGDTDITDISTVMNITAMTYGGTDILATVTAYFDATAHGGNNDGTLQLSELNNKKLDATSMGTALAAPAASGGTKAFAMSVQIAATATNGVQDDYVTTVITFALYQDATQHLP